MSIRADRKFYAEYLLSGKLFRNERNISKKTNNSLQIRQSFHIVKKFILERFLMAIKTNELYKVEIKNIDYLKIIKLLL